MSVVLVTGASSGIGRAVAEAYAAQGADLVLVARDRAALDDVAARCRAAGAGSVEVAPADIGDDDQVARAVAVATTRHDRLDVVVSAAGVVAYGRTEQVRVEVFDGVVRTNLLGSVNLMRHVIPVLRGQRSGTIVLVGSVVGHLRVPWMTPYVLSKWGIRALAGQLRLENRDIPGLRVLHVAPGGVDTPIYAQAANAAGVQGRPPPPVATSEHTAAQVLHRVRRGRGHPQLTPVNDLFRLGQACVPWVYDRLVGPLFRVVAVDQTQPVADTDGNVLVSQPDGHDLSGHHAPAPVSLVRNLRRLQPESRTGHP